MNDRIDHLRNHLAPPPTKRPKQQQQQQQHAQEDSDVVIVAALRTPVTRAKRGGFKDTTPDVLLRHVLAAVLRQTGVDPSQLGDVIVGNVLQPAAGFTMARMAQLTSGIPHTVPMQVINRQCSSGLEAIAQVAASIQAGYYDVGIASGVESMTLTPMGADSPQVDWKQVEQLSEAMDCLLPMGKTSENVATQFGITREQQDQFALLSHQKAVQAQANGKFDQEIVPVQTLIKDADGNAMSVVIEKDDGVRADTSLAKLAQLRPVFAANGTTTAGNASQVSDGAAAVLLMKRSLAKEKGLAVMARLVSYAVVGVPPSVMGIGPAVAIPAVLKKANLTVEDIDLFEINEAFASQASYCIKSLHIPMEKVNVNGGAIALGHPLGCTGARQTATLLHEMQRENHRLGVVSMCIGKGMGAAAIFAREQEQETH